MITLFYSNKLFIKLINNTLYVNIEFVNNNNLGLITLLEYIKNIFLLTKENNNKYFLHIKLINICILSKNIIDNILKTLLELQNIFKTNLHSTCLLNNSDELLTIIKPILNYYKPIRPFKICKSDEEIIQFFNNNILN